MFRITETKMIGLVLETTAHIDSITDTDRVTTSFIYLSEKDANELAFELNAMLQELDRRRLRNVRAV